MLQEHLHIVEQSFSQLQKDAHKLMTGYYANIFAIAPHLRKSFPIDLRALQQDLFASLQTIITNLDNTEIVSSELAKIAKRHREYGLTPSHCLLAKDALMRTLIQQCGPELRWEVREAWANVCSHLLDIATGHSVADQLVKTPAVSNRPENTAKQEKAAISAAA